MDSSTSSQPQTEVGILGLAAVAFLAYALCDLGHEIVGHGLVTLLPLGVQAISVSTVALSTTASSPIVAAAGPLINLILAASLLLAGRSDRSRLADRRDRGRDRVRRLVWTGSRLAVEGGG